MPHHTLPVQTVNGSQITGDPVRLPLYEVLLNNPLFRAMMPRLVAWLPARLKAVLYHLHPVPVLAELRRREPQLYAQALAMAKFAGLSRRELSLVLGAEVLLGHAGPGACSTAALAAARCRGAGPMLLRTLDLPAAFRPYQVLRQVRGPGLPSLQFTLAPMPGCLAGMNPHLALALNVGLSDVWAKSHVPTSLRLSEVLGRCTSTPEVVQFLLEHPFAGGALVTIVDRDSNLAVVEAAGDIVAVRHGEHGIVTATNHYQHAATQPHDATRSETVRPGGPPAVGPGSQQRDDRLWELLEAFAAAGTLLDVAEALSVLRDHGAGDHTADNDHSICRRNPFYETIGAAVLLPAQGVAYAAVGLPCQAEFQRYDLGSGDMFACAG